MSADQNDNNNLAQKISILIAGNSTDSVRAVFISALVTTFMLEFISALIFIYTDGSKNAAIFLLLNSAIGGAAGFVGALLGFIFGIPRALSDQAANGQSRINTNLEQISDWLTKILVGAGLTSISALPGFLAHVVRFLDSAAYSGVPGGGTYAVIIVIYFASLGFFWSYIETRTTLTNLFDSVGQIMLPQDLLAVRAAPAEPGAKPIPQDAVILSNNLDNMKTFELLDAWGSAAMRAGNFLGAAAAFKQAQDASSSNPQILAKLILALAASGKIAEAKSFLDKASSVADVSGSQARREEIDAARVFVAVNDRPGGYTQAIALGEQQVKVDPENALLRYSLARAYGQRAAAAKAGGQDIEADRKLAADQMQEALRLNPHLQGTIAANDKPFPSSELDFAAFAGSG